MPRAPAGKAGRLGADDELAGVAVFEDAAFVDAADLELADVELEVPAAIKLDARFAGDDAPAEVAADLVAAVLVVAVLAAAS